MTPQNFQVLLLEKKYQNFHYQTFLDRKSSSCPKRFGNENSGTFFPTRGLESFEVSLFKEKNKNKLNNIIKIKGKNFKRLLFIQTSDSYGSRYNSPNDYH